MVLCKVLDTHVLVVKILLNFVKNWKKFGDKLDWSLKWDQGKIKKIAFIRDPDGYSIEILGHDLFADSFKEQANL